MSQSLENIVENLSPRHWYTVGPLTDIPRLGSRVVHHHGLPIAIFRTASDTVFAVLDQCPHKKGPLSQGIVHGESVSCPLHGWIIQLDTGEAMAPDHGCTHTFKTRVEEGIVSVELSGAAA
ncbi:nitrite reductase small subunit NirD [Halothiobacillus sp.]|jgi:nitrite reductase (NADH) small subunit|uniref:nitrite reductase small subunit NirD n=1 Tax=Halothiobacillus sp. TaxID=1891311 RepID=UPI002AD2C56B|nr:nitrite reductase small subunit NirD [Halothiobacillus sp.]